MKESRWKNPTELGPLRNGPFGEEVLLRGISQPALKFRNCGPELHAG